MHCIAEERKFVLDPPGQLFHFQKLASVQM